MDFRSSLFENFCLQAGAPVSGHVPVLNILGHVGNITVDGFGFASGAEDYTCRFRTDLMICPMLPAGFFPSDICGEAEMRETSALVRTPFQLSCLTPAGWDLPAMHINMLVAKAGQALRRDNHFKTLYVSVCTFVLVKQVLLH
jgi:hypothetical protein